MPKFEMRHPPMFIVEHMTGSFGTCRDVSPSHTYTSAASRVRNLLQRFSDSFTLHIICCPASCPGSVPEAAASCHAQVCHCPISVRCSVSSAR